MDGRHSKDCGGRSADARCADSEVAPIMNRIFHYPEYRFVVPGRAVSFRSPKAGAYKLRVQEAARSAIDKPLPGPVEIRVDYFHNSHRRMDMDNIAKCIMDALNGLAYIDDRQARLQTSRAHDLSAIVLIMDGPIDLVCTSERHVFRKAHREFSGKESIGLIACTISV